MNNYKNNPYLKNYYNTINYRNFPQDYGYCYYGKKYNIKVEGIGTVKAKPDMATIILGVETQDENLKVAQEKNSKIANELILTLKNMGVKEKDIQTIDYSVDKIYDYIDGERVFKGYKVTNKIEVTVRDIKKLGEIIDSAIEVGANIVNKIEFGLSNKYAYYDKALSLAVENAISKAKNIGNTVGANVNEIPLRVEEVSYNTCYTPREPSLRTPETTTPIETGELEIKARAIAEFQYIKSR